MLWAQFQPRNDSEAAAFVLGWVLAGLFCGGISLGTGLAMRQPVLGVVGGVISGVVGALGGCCLGLPVTILFTLIIVIVGLVMPAASRGARTPPPYADDVEYDEYARPFQLPSSRTSKHDEPPAGMSERDRDRRHQEKYGFRPRKRPAANPEPEEDEI